MALTDFAPGDRVILARVMRLAFRGKEGVVQRLINSRGMVRVLLDDGQTYDAYPLLLDKIHGACLLLHRG